MKHYHFNYLEKFNCIADKCKHNCCIGWEIKVDKKSIKTYQNLASSDNRFNRALNGDIFNLVNTRCAFLDKDNLCHIIKNYGEKSLCKTCKTHPRFKSFFSGVTETGLGLYCEHAGKIILSNKPKMCLKLAKEDKNSKKKTKFEKQLFSFRNKAISIIQNRKIDINERLNKLKTLYNIDLKKLKFDAWIDTYLSLEKLEINEYAFSNLKQDNAFAPILINFEKEYENLLSYLCFRHLSRAIDLLDLRVRLAFCILSFYVINHIFNKCENKDLDNLVEVCRFYSSEIETNDDNIFTLLDKIESLVSYI